MSHFIICTPQLEGEDGQEIFPLEKDFTFEAVGEVDCVGEWRFGHHIVDSRGEDQTQIVGITAGKEEIRRNIVCWKLDSFRGRSRHSCVFSHGQG